MQLVGKGAQDQLVTGNPSFTHFRSVYKRHSDFAMEHFRLYFRSKNLAIPPRGTITLSAKVERYAQLLHDCYLSLTIPSIYSPVSPVTQSHPNLPAGSNAIGYEFQWVKNLGYNMINYVAVLINGQEIVRHTGEWMKLYAELKFDANKKEVLNRLIGNTLDMYEPENAYDRINQYPHSISTSTKTAEPSIYGRSLSIPLHFWFCESVGAALPLIALQYSEVQIVVELKNMYQLFTVLDVRESSSTFGTRIAPDSSAVEFQMNKFLSPPTFSAPIVPTNPDLITWNLNPFLECNYIFLTDPELAHIAKTDHSFMIKQIDMKETQGQYGPSNDLELTMKNLCTRIVWVAQRNDKQLHNDYDNYTNWDHPNKPPISTSGTLTSLFSSGLSQNTSVSGRDILLESALILDGKERFGAKQTEFFSDIQTYRHHTGKTIPGIYSYSFSLDHHTDQPSGHINGSQFNKTVLRNTYIQPPTVSNGTVSQVCVLKSTANSPNPTVVNGALYKPEEVVTIVRKTEANTLQYSYNVRAYVESYNFLRVLGGIANVVFSS